MATDTVFVRGLEFEGNHGYSEEERRTKRRFRVHIELSCDLQAAAVSDLLPDTIDYFQVCQIVIEIGTTRTFKLLEALGGAIASALKERFSTERLTIEIEKLAPPCPGVPQACGVRMVFAAD